MRILPTRAIKGLSRSGHRQNRTDRSCLLRCERPNEVRSPNPPKIRMGSIPAAGFDKISASSLAESGSIRCWLFAGEPVLREHGPARFLFGPLLWGPEGEWGSVLQPRARVVAA